MFSIMCHLGFTAGVVVFTQFQLQRRDVSVIFALP